jgi:hypothetical protein
MVIGKVKTIYKFYKLVFHRRDFSFECFNQATRSYGLWQSGPVIYLILSDVLVASRILIG